MEVVQPSGALDYELVMLSGVIAPLDASQVEKNVCLENLRFLIARVEPTLLRSENKIILECMRMFLDETGGNGLLDEHALMDMLVNERVSPEVQVRYHELFKDYAEQRTAQARFRYAVNRFLRKHEEQGFAEALKMSFTIQTTGAQVKGKMLQGTIAAKKYLQDRMYMLDKSFGIEQVPEGNIRHDLDEVLAEYEKRKNAPTQFLGVLSGIECIDQWTNGAQPGELVMVGGYTESGKSFLCLNWAYHACVAQGRNVVIATAEVTRSQYRQRLALRLCREPKYGLTQGVDSKSFKDGSLTVAEEAAMKAAIADFQTNPKYGNLEIFQIPRNATLSWINAKIAGLNTLWQDTGGVHALFIDSLNLVVPYGKGDEKRHFLNDTVREAKQIAVDFDGGRGIPIISPWHANRRSWQAALEKGHYDLGSWSEADEVEKSADVLMWVLRKSDAHETHEVTLGLEKNRSGEGHKTATLYEDFSAGYLGMVAGPNGSMNGSAINYDERVAGLY